jgi:hypothetical protein
MNTLDSVSLIIVFLCLTYIRHILYLYDAEAEAMKLRLIRLSTTLQRLEYTTGIPYYTNSGKPHAIELP